NTLIRARGAPEISAPDKVKIEKNFEIYLRDVTTRLQARAKLSHKDQDFLDTIRGYENYLTLYPNSKFASKITLNLAESYFSIKRYPRAGYFYEKVFAKTPKKEILDSAIQSYALSLKIPDKISKL